MTTKTVWCREYAYFLCVACVGVESDIADSHDSHATDDEVESLDNRAEHNSDEEIEGENPREFEFSFFLTPIHKLKFIVSYI